MSLYIFYFKVPIFFIDESYMFLTLVVVVYSELNVFLTVLTA